MTHRLFSIGATAAAVILAAGLTIAQGPGQADPSNGSTQRMGPRAGREGPVGRGLEALNLTDEQREKIEGIHRATREYVAPLQKQVADLHEQNRAAILEVLTPEQRETMQTMEGRGGPGRGRGGPRFGRGPGPGGNPQ